MVVSTPAELEALDRPAPAPASTVKVTDRITPREAALIAASPFAVLGTEGRRGWIAAPGGTAPASRACRTSGR